MDCICARIVVIRLHVGKKRLTLLCILRHSLVSKFLGGAGVLVFSVRKQFGAYLSGNSLYLLQPRALVCKRLLHSGVHCCLVLICVFCLIILFNACCEFGIFFAQFSKIYCHSDFTSLIVV